MSDPTKPRLDHGKAVGQATAKQDIPWKRWFLGIVIVLMLVVILQNSQTVEFHLLFISTTTPLIVLLLGTAILGAIVGYAAPIMRRHRHDTRREYGKE